MIDEARHLAQEPKYFNQSSWGSVFCSFFSTFFFLSSFLSLPVHSKRNGTISEYMRKRVEGWKKERNDKEEKGTDQATGTLD